MSCFGSYDKKNDMCQHCMTCHYETAFNCMKVTPDVKELESIKRHFSRQCPFAKHEHGRDYRSDATYCTRFNKTQICEYSSNCLAAVFTLCKELKENTKDSSE